MEDGARGRPPGRPAETKKRKRTHNFHKTPSTTANGPRTKHNVSAESKQVRSLDGARGRPPGRPAGTNTRIGMEDGARGRLPGRPAGTKKRKRTHNFHKTPSTTANGPRTKHNVSAESKQVRSLDGARGRPAGTNKRIGMEDGARGRRAGRKKRKRTDILPREIFHRLLILCVRHLWCHLPWNHICLVGIDECRTGHSSRKKLVVHKVLLVFV
jgi:hypothetical protein